MTAVPAPSLAIITPWKDFLFFFASAGVVLVAWFASAVLHVDGFTILSVVAVASNGPHLVSTWTRVYFDPAEWKPRLLSTVAVPVAVFVAVFAVTWQLGLVGTRGLNSLILYWATWHFVAQNWGILRIYQRKSGEPMGTAAMRLERPILLLSALFCLLQRLHTGPRTLFGAEVFSPPIPFAVPMAVLAPLVVLAMTLMVVRVRERQAPWAKASWVRLGFIGCCFLGFFVPFQLITTDDTSAFAAAACWHGFQYLGMMRHYHRLTWKQGVDRRARLVSWLGQPGWARGFLYWALLMTLAGTVFAVVGALTALTSGQYPFSPGLTAALGHAPVGPGFSFFQWSGVVWVSLTLSHYWVDGLIWKLRRPEVASRVGLADAQNASPTAA